MVLSSPVLIVISCGPDTLPSDRDGATSIVVVGVVPYPPREPPVTSFDDDGASATVLVPVGPGPPLGGTVVSVLIATGDVVSIAFVTVGPGPPLGGTVVSVLIATGDVVGELLGRTDGHFDETILGGDDVTDSSAELGTSLNKTDGLTLGALAGWFVSTGTKTGDTVIARVGIEEEGSVSLSPEELGRSLCQAGCHPLGSLEVKILGWSELAGNRTGAATVEGNTANVGVKVGDSESLAIVELGERLGVLESSIVAKVGV